MDKPFDLIVFGATGFTGRLVAQFLNTAYGVGGEVSWAMAGRNLDRLTEVRRQIGASTGLPLIVADVGDAASLDGLVRQTRVIVTTVGPYRIHGTALVEACAGSGTDYVDLCGEPLWMAQMIDRLQPAARTSGARIVFSCGFDSIPFDLGVVFLQQQARRRFGAAVPRVSCRVRVLKGGLSGGTLASALATHDDSARDPALARALADPFALTPGFRGPAQPDDPDATYDDAASSWTAPFMMAPINTKNVHRTNALVGHPWGPDFVYDERVLCGDGPRGERRARSLARVSRIQNAVLRSALARAVLRHLGLPRPGHGPGARERETGRWELLLIGRNADGRMLRAVVAGDRDPGYGSTSKMIAESALCLLRDVDRGMTAGGVWTPGAAMGLALVRRLQARAGLSFAVDG